MKNKALIEVNETLCNYLDGITSTYVFHKIGDYGTMVTKEVWNSLTADEQKALVIAKTKEVNELYPDSPLYGAYEDIYITLVEEDITGLELESELEQFARDVIFREYSNKELEEMIKHFSIAQLED